MRKCTIDNETLKTVVSNIERDLEKNNMIYICDVAALLEKALEGIDNQKDLCDSEKLDIKNIRNMIKGL